jgi:DeoR/GlpR family transcriptional regulator of sugar metabolism
LEKGSYVEPKFLVSVSEEIVMSCMERIFQIDQMPGNRAFVTRAELEERLGISWATLKRDIAYMRDPCTLL